MDIKNITIEYLKEICDKIQDLDVSKDMAKIINFLSQTYRNENWIKKAYDFMATLYKKYEPIKYYIDKYDAAKKSNSSIEILTDHLSISGICLYAEIYIEQTKHRN